MFSFSDPNTPSSDPMDETVLTRFIKEFKLEKEALAFQYAANNAIQTFNKVVYNTDSATGATANVDTGSTGSTSSVSSRYVHTCYSTSCV